MPFRLASAAVLLLALSTCGGSNGETNLPDVDNKSISDSSRADTVMSEIVNSLIAVTTGITRVDQTLNLTVNGYAGTAVVTGTFNVDDWSTYKGTTISSTVEFKGYQRTSGSCCTFTGLVGYDDDKTIYTYGSQKDFHTTSIGYKQSPIEVDGTVKDTLTDLFGFRQNSDQSHVVYNLKTTGGKTYDGTIFQY
jgi:hypothetical protein